MLTFVVYSVSVFGTLTKHDHLGHAELDTWMAWAYGKFATVHVEASNGKSARYTDNGEQWERVNA
jgi:hypothetical protein